MKKLIYLKIDINQYYWPYNLNMKKCLLFLMLTILLGCNGNGSKGNNLSPTASTICSGTTILNIVGTADCSGTGGSASDPLIMLSFASRKDNDSFPVTGPEFVAFFAAADRVVATLQDEAEDNSTFNDNHSVIASPLEDSDGRFKMTDQDGNDVAASTEKKHYLETIAKNGPITSRANIVVCGISGTIEARITDCHTLNGLWSLYDGKKYGQDGEGDWKLVSVLDNAGTKYEVWRDERTNLLWSDVSSLSSNWYQAAGYSKPDALSYAESDFLSAPDANDPVGGILQPTNPISICADVISGEIAAGGGTPSYIYVNPQSDFKAGLTYPQTTWRLASINDWKLADVNGIRKVLPNMDLRFWSTSSDSRDRSKVWSFNGDNGTLGQDHRTFTLSTRCVASSRD